MSTSGAVDTSAYLSAGCAFERYLLVGLASTVESSSWAVASPWPWRAPLISRPLFSRGEFRSTVAREQQSTHTALKQREGEEHERTRRTVRALCCAMATSMMLRSSICTSVRTGRCPSSESTMTLMSIHGGRGNVFTIKAVRAYHCRAQNVANGERTRPLGLFVEAAFMNIG